MDRICMYTPSADGGHARYAWELMTALAAHPRSNGGGCYQFELVSSEDLREPFRSAPYPVHSILPALRHRGTFATRLSWAANRLTHYPRREMRFLKWLRTQPDVAGVHFQEWTPWLAAPMFRRIRDMGKKVFYTVHNIVPHKYPAFVPRATMDGWIRRACLLCDGLFVLSDRLSGELSDFLGRPHPPIRVAPHGVWTVPDLAVPLPLLHERLSWKRLLFFGAIRRNKGLDLLLRAAQHMPDYSITIAGEPADPRYFRDEVLPQVRRLRDAGARIDLRDRFTPDDEVGELFADHSAVVLPYTREFVAQSGVVFLALAYELPVVASEAGGLRDLFRDFQIGTTFRDATPQGLAAAVRALCDGADRPGIVGEIRAAKEWFSWRAAAEATVAAYAAAQHQATDQDPWDVRDDCSLETTAAP